MMSWVVLILFGLFSRSEGSAGLCELVSDPTNLSRVYDLNPLASDISDYIIPNTRYPTYNFRINICRPILTPNGGCDQATGVCEQGTTTSTKIGEYSKSFQVIENGKLVMTLPRGSGCNSARFNFICDPLAGKGSPVYVSESCEYVFEWRTEYACSRPRDPIDPCFFKLGDDVVDLRPLDGVYQVYDSTTDRSYSINPCTPLTEQQSSCVGGNTFGCQQASPAMSYSIGRAFFNVTRKSDKIIADYGFGDVCIGGNPRQFSITYMCGVGLGTPVFVKEVNCHYYFEWVTSLACIYSDFECIFSISGRIYDFRPLDKTWTFDLGLYRYQLNPCSYVNTTTLACSSSFGCQSFQTDPRSGFSLAKWLFGVTPFPSSNVTATFEYINGDSCQSGSSKKSMTIDFGCKNGDLGNPKLYSASDCLYKFEWQTSVAC